MEGILNRMLERNFRYGTVRSSSQNMAVKKYNRPLAQRTDVFTPQCLGTLSNQHAAKNRLLVSSPIGMQDISSRVP